MIDVAPAGAAARTAHPLVVTGARALAAVALHAIVAGAIGWAIDPVISETSVWAWPSSAQAAQLGELWLQTTVAPALVWAAIVLARAARRRRVEGTFFVLSAAVVAIVAFALAVPLILLEVPVQATGIAIAAWLLVACALAVIIAAQVARERRAPR
ncbi:hypothetical protein [Agrococcus baldri]|uniref:Uncharacterized protein n=1 Tax=Agrococcus baldri TaxID=153730 RepID=A0AA87USB3_9MICO|nr:hypothetical protein [Agrococcus baldri]GEK80220.1 hypothetical protein ABA31_15710 [Agrococcus baldri]